MISYDLLFRSGRAGSPTTAYNRGEGGEEHKGAASTKVVIESPYKYDIVWYQNKSAGLERFRSVGGKSDASSPKWGGLCSCSSVMTS